jgi:hypothetical protein
MDCIPLVTNLAANNKHFTMAVTVHMVISMLVVSKPMVVSMLVAVSRLKVRLILQPLSH